MPFPIDFDGRPYNTLTLPCERVITDGIVREMVEYIFYVKHFYIILFYLFYCFWSISKKSAGINIVIKINKHGFNGVLFGDSFIYFIYLFKKLLVQLYTFLDLKVRGVV